MLRWTLPVLLVGLASVSSAHFLWSTVENGQTRNVTFVFAEEPGDSELPIVSGLAPRITFPGGQKLDLVKRSDSAWCLPVGDRKLPLLVELHYGFPSRGEQDHVIDYYTKAVSRASEAATPVGKGFEIVAKPLADKWLVTVLKDGKPCPTAEIVFDGPEKEERYKADKPVEIPLPDVPEAMGIRAVNTIEQKGTFAGKPYKSVNQWTSLMLPAIPKVPAGGDVTAFRALQEASENRESLNPAAFAWSADFRATNGADVLKGTAAGTPTNPITLTFADNDHPQKKYVQQELSSLFFHRLDTPFYKSDGRYPLKWSGDENAIGKQILVGDKMNSSYRIKNGVITEVDRTMGNLHLILEIQDVQVTPTGTQLSKRFVGRMYDAKTGALTSVLNYEDAFTRVGDQWLPLSRTVKGKYGEDEIEMRVQFSNYKITPNPAPVAAAPVAPIKG